MAYRPITHAERQSIIEELKSGTSQHRTAQLFRRSKRTINVIARENDIKPSNPYQTRKATHAWQIKSLTRKAKAIREALESTENGKELLMLVDKM